ncbi:MAG: O-antigen ligase family protein [Roseiflexaceae bacterium]
MNLVRGLRLPGVLVCAVCYLIAAVPAQDYLMIAGRSHSQLATVVFVVALIIHWALHRPLVVPHDETLWARLAVVTALVLATGWSAYAWQNGIDEIRRWGLALCVGYVVAVVPQSRRDVAVIVAVLCLAPIAAACFAFVQSLRGIGPAAFAIAGTGFTRANGTIGQPNSFAGYINGAWPLLLVVTAWGHRTQARWRWPVTAGLIVCGLVLLLSFSRGGWFGACAGVLAMLVVAGGLWRRMALVVVVVVVLVFAGGWRIIPGPIGVRLGTASQVFSAPRIARNEAQQRPDIYAAVERAMQFDAGVAMWKQSPILGIGPGSYTLAYPDVAYNGWWISRGHAHNAYIQIAAEQGVIGLFAYLVLLWVSLRRAYALRLSDPFARALAIGLCGTAVAVAAHECFEYLRVNYLPIHVAAVMGLAGAVPRVCAAEEGI